MEKQSTWQSIREWLYVIVISLSISLLFTLIAKPTVVSGDSMNPTYEDRDWLFVSQLSYKFGEPSYSDVIVFDAPATSSRILIKRIIGLAGDEIKIEEGKVYRNGELLKEEYAEAYTPGVFEGVVPEGHVFVMGDNRDNSLDSRFSEVGYVHEEQIIGKATVRIFPLNKMGIAP